MSFLRRLRHRTPALCIALAVAMAGLPVGAVEAPPGSRNFTPPGDVPNYFSNESGPFLGGATAGNAPPGGTTVAAAPPPRSRVAGASHRAARHHAAHAAKARGRTRLAQGKANGHRQVAHAGAARRSTTSGSKMAHARLPPTAGKAVAAKSGAASSKGKRLAQAHG